MKIANQTIIYGLEAKLIELKATLVELGNVETISSVWLLVNKLSKFSIFLLPKPSTKIKFIFLID